MSENAVIKARECRFAIHIPTRSADVPDLHLVKEVLHYEDGRTVPNVRYVKDFKRPFAVTQKHLRNHQQKKEYEPLENLMVYECTQSELPMRVAQALGLGYMRRPQMRQLSDSPYLYGSDITSTALLKYSYKRQYPDTFSPYSVCFFDIETDVLHGTDDPIVITMVYKQELVTLVQAQLVQGYADPEGLYFAKLKKHLGDKIEARHYTPRFHIVDDTVSLIREAFKYIHAWMPDFLAIWNMDFDIPRILDTLKKYKVDPADIFCDPKLPSQYRFCEYKKGSTKKITASGAVKPKNPSEQWHSLLVPASYYVIDAMCSYRFVRQGEQEQQSYSLDAILAREKLAGKLRFPEADGYVDLEWHQFMQKNYPFEYLCYADQDVIGMDELDEKTGDLAQSLPVQCDITDFAKFSHQTKRFADGIHVFLLNQGKMVGTVAPRKEAVPEDTDITNDEDDDEGSDGVDQEDEFGTTKSDTMSLRGWVVTLKAHMSVLGGAFIEEAEKLLTLIRAFVYDSDAVSAYPTCTAVGNVSKRTTLREIIDIIGIEEVDFRRHNINLLQGHVNALEYACEMYKLPRPQDALKYFDDLAA